MIVGQLCDCVQNANFFVDIFHHLLKNRISWRKEHPAFSHHEDIHPSLISQTQLIYDFTVPSEFDAHN